VDCCFSELALLKSVKICHLALNNNHSLIKSSLEGEQYSIMLASSLIMLFIILIGDDYFQYLTDFSYLPLKNKFLMLQDMVRTVQK
jgi:hypothetical protein